MASIYLLIQSEKNPAVIYIRLRDGRTKDIKAKTNYHIDPQYWDKEAQRPTKKALKEVQYANLDSDLAKLKNDLLKKYNYSKGVELVDSAWLNDFINPKQEITNSLPETLIEYMDTYIEYRRSEIKSSTIAKCNVIKQLLKRYQDHKKTIVFIRNVDAKFKLDFEKYCVDQGYAQNTTSRNIRFIKTCCRHAKANGVETHYQLDSIKAKYLKVESIYLSDTDIKQIEDMEESELSDAHKNARDWLLISCYCGQRVSDFLRFDKSMIRYEANKSGVLKPLIEFTQVKTDKLMTVPLHTKIITILDKNNGDFPRKISDQKYNDYIKKVCEAAEITKPTQGTLFDSKTKSKITKEYPKHKLVSSHIGRRSFATNNYGKIPTSFLMYVTGHTTEAMFLTYIGKSNKDIAMELTNYF
jgi:hypothetical protein